MSNSTQLVEKLWNYLCRNPPPNPRPPNPLALLKSARDIMREGKGLNGDVGRLPSSCHSFGLTGRGGIIWLCGFLGLRSVSAQALTFRAFSPPVFQGRRPAM